MGTSNAYGGASGLTPLIPSWLDDEPSSVDGAASSPSDGQEPPDVPLPPQAISYPPKLGSSDRFQSARNNFTRFVTSGGSDRKSLGRAVSRYVRKSTGGARRAATRMGSSRRVGAGLVGFLNNASENGAIQALSALDLDTLVGRPIEEIFSGLIDNFCPDGGSIDEGIAREAFVETIADLAAAGVTDIDHLSFAQVQTVFELYITHTIEARICNDIGLKVITMPSDPQAAELVSTQLREFIHRGVSDAIQNTEIAIHAINATDQMEFVLGIYESAFEILRAMGETEGSE